MCGRFVSTVSSPELEALFFAQHPEKHVDPNYNVAPSGEVYGVIATATSAVRKVEVLRWGLQPSWNQRDATSPKFINARIETVDTKPAFAEAFAHRRCIIPADGFYEWQGAGRKSKRRPMYIYRSDRSPIFMAGVWNRSSRNDRPSFAILTTEANTFMSKIHGRMPAVLQAAACDEWLSVENSDARQLKVIAMSGSKDSLDAHYVDAKVGNTRRSGPDLISPVPAGTLWDE
ncbi:MAG: SOS response-associated peptidase [Acidimicrobiales bacterium]|nr:SOS response-associated peptidase [Acidimicrobiales bacterium]